MPPAAAPSIALVLGAGGVAGAAHHAGALAAIGAATGWDARRAALIVGTSAGAGVAAWVRAGLSPDDLLARLTGDPLSDVGRRLVDRGPRSGRFPPEPEGRGLPLPAAPWLVGAALLPPGRPRPVVGLAGVLPRGRRPTAVLGDGIRAAHQERWPEAPTWLCVLRLRDGRRVVLGRDDVEVDHLATAVEASSAIPGFLRPVEIAGETYVDGGAHSSTNADVVADAGFDLVVVIAPMAAVPAALRRGRPDWGRLLHSRVLAREVRSLRERGTEVLVLQPTAEDLAVRSDDVLDVSQSARVARRAARSTDQRLGLADAGPAVALLRRASQG